MVQSIFDILKIHYTKPNDPMNSIHRSEVKHVERTPPVEDESVILGPE